MPEIVEILAPSGTGKTTLYKGLQRKWNSEAAWTVYHDFRYNRRILYRSPVDHLHRIRRKLNRLKTELFSSDIQYQLRSVHQQPNEILFYDTYPEFCDAVMELILKNNASGFNKQDKRFLSAYYMFETIEHLQAVLNHPEDKRICIMDEGLLSRLMHLNSPTFTDKELNNFLMFMPVPAAVIYLKCDAELIVKRIMSRKKRSTVHRDLSKEDIYRSTISTQKLMEKTLTLIRDKGTLVFEVNAENDSKKMLHQVYGLIKDGNLQS